MIRSDRTVRMLAVLAASAALAAEVRASTNAFSIGINFGPDQLVWDYAAGAAGGTSELAPEDLAGIPGVQQKNWNNALDGGSGPAFNAYPTPAVLDNLVADDKGAAVPTTASVSWQAQGTWSTSGSRGAAENLGTNFFPNTPDNKLMTGYLDTTAGGSPTLITITNIPAQLLNGAYNVFVYSMGGAFNANRGGSIRVYDAATGVALTPDKLITSPTARPTSYVEDLGVNHTDNGIYVRFNGIAASAITVEATIGRNPNNATPRANVNAVQLVAAGLTEPIVNGVVANGQSFNFSISDLPTAQLDPATVTVKMDGASTNLPVVVGQKNNGLTAITYDILADKKIFFASGSTHTNIIEFKDTTGRSFSATRVFTVITYQTVSASYALPPTAADTTKPGFKVRVHQHDTATVIRAPGDRNLIVLAERELANDYVDAATGQPYPNVADISQADADGYFAVPGVINWNGQAGAIGNFSANSTPPRDDEAIPGIPGTTGSTDNFATEILTYLNMKAGFYRFGFNSDDGFRASHGPGFDVAGTPIIANFNGGRGAADTTWDVVFPVDGIYPLRISYWQGTGGVNAELFYFDQAGNKVLINDPQITTAPRAYRETTVSRPSITRAIPVQNWIGAAADDDIVVDITDGTIPLAGEVKLRINGTDQTVTATKSGKVTTITRDSSLTNLLPSGNNNVQLIYGFTENGAVVSITNNYTFFVAPYYGVLNPASRVPSGSVSGSGFSSRVHQIDRSGDANQGNGGRISGNGDANRMPAPEAALQDLEINPTTGQPYPNLAAKNGDSFIYPFELLNFNITAAGAAANSGLFQAAAPATPLPGTGHPDEIVPGLPGTGTSQSGIDNYAMEAVTYLELKRGVYIFGFNSDDGFVAANVTSPNDTLGTVVGFANFGRGNSGNIVAATIPSGTNPNIVPGSNSGSTTFSVIVPEDGIYPFRLLWWQGGGGVNSEFFTMDKDNGQVLLVNATSDDPRAVKAYSTSSAVANRPYVRYSVAPTPWDNVVQQTGPGPIVMLGRTLNSVASSDIHNNNGAARPWADVAIGGVVANGVGDPSLGLILDGNRVTPTFTTNGTDVTVSYRPNPPLAPNSTHVAGLIYGDTTNSWPFAVQNYTTINATNKAAGTGDPNARGFQVKVAQATTGQANTVARAEGQLQGSVPNVAIAGTGPGGSHIETNIVNWSVTANGLGGVQIGNFQSHTYNAVWPWPSYADRAVPGIPGTGLSGNARFENISAEIFAYLQFDQPGYYRFGVNGDDGWAVKVGTPGVTNGPVLFTTDRGAGAQDIPFSFVVPEAGLYPVRLVWYQGGGGGNVEFFSYGDSANAEKIPINDPNNPKAIKAFYALSTADVVRISAVTLSGGQITITWTGGGTLESATSLTNPSWTSTGNSTGTFTEAATGAGKFYRVRR